VTPSSSSSQAFLSELTATALEHHAVRHPYLQDLAEGNLPDLHFALADFADHYYGYSAHFPRYLTAVISRLEDPAHRHALLENLTEERGMYQNEELNALTALGIQRDWIVGIPHPELFERFRSALNVHNSTSESLEVVCWREMFLAVLSHGSPAEAIGALGLGTETIVQTMYRPFVRAIDRLGTIHPRDAVFFPLHTAVDDHHQTTLKQVAAAFAHEPQGRLDLAKGMLKALQLREAFWSWLHQRAKHPENAQPIPRACQA
jgi:pyrroloquinoline quinone (PQQ) biosynthesis protein C